jgi:subtilase family serine protease
MGRIANTKASWIGLLLFFAFEVCLIIAPIFRADRAFAQTSAARPLITESIDESRLVTLWGNTRPEANAANDRGAVPGNFPMEHMLLQLRRSPEQELALAAFIDQLHDRTSPSFHRWLSPSEFGGRFGLAPRDVQTITRWLQGYGFRINSVYPSRMLIDFSGTAGQVRAHFHTEIRRLLVNGVSHVANMSNPRIPAALAPAVAGIVTLNDFRPKPQFVPKSQYTEGGGFFELVPADLATIYNFNPLFNSGVSGQGQTVTVVEDTDLYTDNDWTTFRSVLGLSSYAGGALTTVHPGSCTDPGVNGDDGEAIIDAEWASAAAPSAAIVVASCGGTSATYGFLLAAENLINQSTRRRSSA